jgi:hypothetical protein
MADEKHSYVRTGDVSGTGIAIGQDVQSTVSVNQGTQRELLDLLQQLQSDIRGARVPQGAKDVLLTRALPEMEKAARSEDPTSGLQRGLERVDEQLQGAGVLAEHVSGLIGTAAKIAAAIGVPLVHVAPYLAALL